MSFSQKPVAIILAHTGSTIKSGLRFVSCYHGPLSSRTAETSIPSNKVVHSSAKSVLAEHSLICRFLDNECDWLCKAVGGANI